MKLIATFDDFLTNVVNLNSTRVSLLEDSIVAIKSAVKASDWKPKIINFAAQGSWAHKTIIRPLAGNAFDADLLIYVEPVDGWNAKDYVNELYAEFCGLSTYKDKVRRYSHCVTVEYAGERKIDISPCIQDRLYSGVLEVCNRDTDQFERSNPQAYTDWLIRKNVITGNNNFRKATRLLKYMRDIKTNFTCPSFLLTTLLGERVYESDDGAGSFSDVPTALKGLIDRLDDWLQSNSTKPTIRNPVLYEDVQSNAWDDTKYANFRSKINLYREWIDDAYNEVDKEESLGKWQRVFGEDFAASETIEKAGTVSEAAITVYRGNPIIAGITDLVGLVKRLGRAALPSGFDRLPHMRRPKWKVSTDRMTVNISAQLFTGRSEQRVGTASSLDALQPGFWLRFDARSNLGMPFPDSFKVMWRVTNTDEVARKAKALRGDFYSSDDHHCRWEQLSYRGVHMVEAFLIRTRDDVQIGKSDPFYVVIE